MKATIYKYILAGAIVSVFSILCLTPASTLAQQPQVGGLNVVAASGVELEAKIYNYTTKNYDSKITWSNLSQPEGWKLADQCLEITHTSGEPLWGIEIYTDNKNNTLPYAKSYTGKQDPAGLIGQITTTQALAMAWIAYPNWSPNESLPDEPVERPHGEGFVGGSWHWLRDLNTPENKDTGIPPFSKGEDYSTIWNQKGVAAGDRENERTANPKKVYLFLAADFATATKQFYKTNSLTLEHFTDDTIEVFPFYLYKDGAPAVQMAYEHISGKMDKYFGGNQNRLIESYSEPYPPGPGGNLKGVAFTYDNAVAICAYLARPTEENLFRAKLLCKTLILAQENDLAADGRLMDAYYATKEFTGTAPPIVSSFSSSSTGNIAWVINALMQYYKNSSDSDPAFLDRVLSACKAAGEFIHNHFYDPSQPGYYHGYNADGTLNLTKSTEHNIIAYVAFSHLYDATGANKWLTRANNAKSFVTDIAGRPEYQRYICGLNPDGTPNLETWVADTDLLAILALDPLSLNPLTDDTLDFFVSNYYFCDAQRDLEGIDFGYNINNIASEPDGIWFEGTAMLAGAYKITAQYGLTDHSEKYLESIKRAQYDALNADYKSIVAASKDGLTTGLGWGYYASPHIAPTAWFAGVKMNYNMLWGTALNEAVPKPGDNKTFTQNPALLIDNTNYLENHYYPSGWMNYKQGTVFVDARCADNPYSGDSCFKISWNGQAGGNGLKWTALVWQEPENEWNGGPGKGYDLRGAESLSFWARTDSWSIPGGEPLQIKVYFGYSNDSSGQTPPTPRDKLTTEWKQYIIPVLGRNMSHVSNGFTIMLDDPHPPGNDGCNIYLDDIEYRQF